MKPFEETTPEEIARKIGGSLSYRSGKPWRIYVRNNYFSYIDLAGYPLRRERGGSLPYLRIMDDVDFKLNDAVVILREKSVAFVKPIQLQGDDIYSWVEISEANGISLYTVDERQRNEVDFSIIQAARLAADLKEKAKSRAAV